MKSRQSRDHPPGPAAPAAAHRPTPRSTTGLAGIAVAALVLLGMLFAAYAVHDRNAALAEGHRQAEQLAEQTALVAESTFDGARQLLRTIEVISRPPGPGKPADPEAIRTALLVLKSQNPSAMDFLVLDAEGRITHWTGIDPPPDVRDRPYYTHHASQAASGLFIGEPLVSKVRGERWFVALSEAVRDPQGRIQRIAVSMIESAYLHDRLGNKHTIAGHSQTLLTEDGIVHARQPGHAAYIGKRLNRPEQFSALSPRTPAITFRSASQIDRVDRIISLRKVQGFPLVAAGTVAVEPLLSPWTRRTAFLAGLWFALVLAAAFALRLASRGIDADRRDSAPERERP